MHLPLNSKIEVVENDNSFSIFLQCPCFVNKNILIGSYLNEYSIDDALNDCTSKIDAYFSFLK